MHNPPVFATNPERPASLGQIADSVQQHSGQYGDVYL